MLSKKSKRLRKINKELKSFKNKLDGKNLIWFNSLTSQRQYTVLLQWKNAKWVDKKQSKTKIRKWNSKLKKFELVDRPVLKFKHWIKVTRARFIPSRKNVRNSTIDIILNENRK